MRPSARHGCICVWKDVSLQGRRALNHRIQLLLLILGNSLDKVCVCIALLWRLLANLLSFDFFLTLQSQALEVLLPLVYLYLKEIYRRRSFDILNVPSHTIVVLPPCLERAELLLALLTDVRATFVSIEGNSDFLLGDLLAFTIELLRHYKGTLLDKDVCLYVYSLIYADYSSPFGFTRLALWFLLVQTHREWTLLAFVVGWRKLQRCLAYIFCLKTSSISCPLLGALALGGT